MPCSEQRSRNLLARDIAAWDAKSADAILQVYRKHSRKPSFPADLVNLMADETLQRGVTWLVKRRLDEGDAPLEPALLESFLTHVDRLPHWESKLHVLQCLERLGIPNSRATAVEALVRECLRSERTLLRAWAYSGFKTLALRFPSFREEALGVLAEGSLKETAGSVRVRVREARKELGATDPSTA